jgi:hypothetical protein
MMNEENINISINEKSINENYKKNLEELYYKCHFKSKLYEYGYNVYGKYNSNFEYTFIILSFLITIIVFIAESKLSILIKIITFLLSIISSTKKAIQIEPKMSNYKQFCKTFEKYTFDIKFMLNLLLKNKNHFNITRYNELVSQITTSFYQSPIVPYKISDKYINEIKSYNPINLTKTIENDKTIQNNSQTLPVIDCDNTLNNKFQKTIKDTYNINLTPDKIYILERLNLDP